MLGKYLNCPNFMPSSIGILMNCRYKMRLWCLLLALICAIAKHRKSVTDVSKHGNWNNTYTKIWGKIQAYDQQRIATRSRNLIIFHVGELLAHVNTMEVSINNLKIFVGSLLTHYDSSPQAAFYLFNIVHGKDNPLSRYVPKDRHNVGTIEWNHSDDIIEIHMRTLRMLGKEIMDSFGAVFFFNQDVRGPLLYRENGEWLGQYRALLDANNVGMVGPTFSCEILPHVQTHAFGVRASVLHLLLQLGEPVESTKLTSIIGAAGYNVSSMLYHMRFRQPYFNNYCAPGCGSSIQPTLNPISWCNVVPSEVIFMDWGGEPVRSLGFLCEITIAMMRNTLADLADAHPSLELVVPETLVGGNLYELYKEYNEELYKDRIKPKPPKRNTAMSTALVTSSQKRHHTSMNSGLYNSIFNNEQKQSEAAATDNINDDTSVCFAVRTASIHDITEAARAKNMVEDTDISSFIESLLRQTNPHWIAFFFITDTNPFDMRLQDILDIYRDPRLLYLVIDPIYRIPFTKEDAGYTMTDYVMSRLIHRRECRWLTLTNADNVYGSEIVERVMNVAPQPVTHQVPDMLLNPIDSRNFAAQDYDSRRELVKGMGVEQSWTDFCTALEATLLFNSYTYTIQPSPVIGRVDLAAVFYNRAKYASENIRFSNFTNPLKYPCLGCQDGYLTQYLVRQRRWTYARLSIDGLKSIVFHGPSPTWCIAQGKVWYDYPQVNKVGCLSQQTVRTLSHHNPKYYDWIHLNYKDNKICLRLSRFGFHNETSKLAADAAALLAITTAATTKDKELVV